MTEEFKKYIRFESLVAAVFNFLLNGMIIGLIYHNTNVVPMSVANISMDIALTCLLMFILCPLFCCASLRRTKTAGILDSGIRLLRWLSRLLQRPFLYGFTLGIFATIIFSTLAVTLFILYGVYTMPFSLYLILKVLFTALLGGSITALTLCAGMHRVEDRCL